MQFENCRLSCWSCLHLCLPLECTWFCSIIADCLIFTLPCLPSASTWSQLTSVDSLDDVVPHLLSSLSQYVILVGNCTSSCWSCPLSLPPLSLYVILFDKYRLQCWSCSHLCYSSACMWSCMTSADYLSDLFPSFAFPQHVCNPVCQVRIFVLILSPYLPSLSQYVIQFDKCRLTCSYCHLCPSSECMWSCLTSADCLANLVSLRVYVMMLFEKCRLSLLILFLPFTSLYVVIFASLTSVDCLADVIVDPSTPQTVCGYYIYIMISS